MATAARHPRETAAAERDAMRKKSNIAKILSILEAAYPDVKTQLDHNNPFQMLIATILSAQCTDRQVNAVTPALFRALPTPQAMAEADLSTIEKLIRSTGFYRNKAKHIKNCARSLLDGYGGQVPDTLEDLTALQGVGRKTANVVLSACFGRQTIVVDTHVARISRRLGLTDRTDPVKIEFELMDILPKARWSDFCLQLIYHGRAVCSARNPKCSVCPLAPVCPSAKG
jgi:endonuclease-3